MNKKSAGIVVILSTSIAFSGVNFPSAWTASAQTSETGQPAIAKRIGTIKAIDGNTITLTPDSGPAVAVVVQANARILRMSPRDKDLKNATPVQLQDLKVGDQIRVRGRASGDGIDALEVLVITSSALDAVREQIRQDWQKRGVGGLVDSVDVATGKVTISIPSLAGKKTMLVRMNNNAVVKRYSPDSVKFEDAKPSSLNEIHSGDQLRAKGDRSADGSELAADEIVAGTFPFITGTIKSVDASAGTISVQDLVSKKIVQVKVTSESQLHKIPAEMAQRFAARLKGSMPMGMPGATAGSSTTAPAPGNAQPGNGAPSGGIGSAGKTGGGGMGAGMRSGQAPDFQQIISRLPSSTLEDLHLQKGDAVVILGTGGTPSTAITLLSGVEPILQAAPSASQAMMLTPWSLGGAPGGDASQ
jgi:Domain of unknown function (DUF5666)